MSVANSIVFISILVGAFGFHFLENIGWIDSIYNATLILTGMGPINVLKRPESKIFASLFAIYGGVVILVMTGIVLSPIAHRLLHLFNLREDEG